MRYVKKFRDITITATIIDKHVKVKFTRNGKEISCPLGFYVDTDNWKIKYNLNAPLGYVYISIADIGLGKAYFKHCTREGEELYNILLELAQEIDFDTGGYGGDGWVVWIDNEGYLNWSYFD